MTEQNPLITSEAIDRMEALYARQRADKFADERRESLKAFFAELNKKASIDEPRKIDEIPTVEKSKNHQRDDDFINWEESTKLNLDAMTKKEIHQELIKRNPTLWTRGFNDWVKFTEHYEGKPGRKKG